MNREELIIHLYRLLQKRHDADKTYREALEWDAISADPQRHEFEETDNSVLFKYVEVTDSYHCISDSMSNEILQHVVENWGKIKLEILETMRKTWLEVENEYLTCLEKLRISSDNDDVCRED